MKIEMIKGTFYSDDRKVYAPIGTKYPGCIAEAFDCPDKRAEELIKAGFAKKYTGKKDDPTPEQVKAALVEKAISLKLGDKAALEKMSADELKSLIDKAGK